jgi:acyl-CoA reductase-like NAD-dependent aldehyde dehydrogenase
MICLPHQPNIQISTDHYINGARVTSTQHFELNSPINGHFLGNVAQGLAEHTDAAVKAARNAFPEWAGLGAAKRREYLYRFADEIGKRSDPLCQAESVDAGVLLSRMQHGIVPRAKLNITFFADHALTLQDQVLQTDQATHHVKHDPAGVCVIITPWNAPLMLTTWKLGPALASGNTVVIKPPEWAPLTCSLLADAAHAAGIPKGVINIVQGTGGVTGAALVADSRVSRISFTGSVPTAKLIAQAAAKNLTPVSLELGGKSPFIVLADADLESAAACGALMYRNATQVCLAGTRFLVHSAIYDEFVRLMRHQVAKLVVGDPRQAATEVGPIIHPRQFEKVQGFVDRALAQGATVLWGGKPAALDDPNCGPLYFEPTMLSNVRQDSEIVQHEVFGPVLVIQSFDTDDQAIAMANDSQYGLGGVCYGAAAHAQAVAERVHTGFMWINSFGIRDLNAPFGGIKQSGMGREGGQWSFEFFCNIKDVVLPKKPFVPNFSQR